MHEEESGEEEVSVVFRLFRCAGVTLLGCVGMGVTVVGVFFASTTLDKALSNPLGASTGFLSMGHLTTLSTAASAPLGALWATYLTHRLAGGKGSVWVALVGVLVGLAIAGGLSYSVRGLMFPAFVLLPLVAAVALELSTVSLPR
jgi:hypothetical protein